MKRRLALLFFVAMFAILSCNYALAFFESDRDYIGSERKAKSFHQKLQWSQYWIIILMRHLATWHKN